MTMGKKESVSAHPDFAYVDFQSQHAQPPTKSRPRTIDIASFEDKELGLRRGRHLFDDGLWEATGPRIAVRQAGAGRTRGVERNDVISVPINQLFLTRPPTDDDSEEEDRQYRPFKAARKHGADIPAQIGRKAAKKHKAVNVYESEESSEELEEADTDTSQDIPESRDRRRKSAKASKTARGHRVPVAQYKHREEEDASGAEHYPVDKIPSWPAESSITGGPAIPASLLRAINSLPLSSGRLRGIGKLPFLRRNLRRAFEYKFRQATGRGQDSFEETIEGRIEVVYQLQLRDDPEPGDESDVPRQPHLYEEYKAVMDKLLCPICNLHGVFSASSLLKKHLERDHSEVGVIWEFSSESRQIILSVPHPDSDYDETTSSPPESTSVESDAEDATARWPLITPSPSRDPSRSQALSTDPVENMTVDSSPSHLKVKLRPKYHASRSPTASSQAQSSIAAPNLGPAARPPYLPHGNIQFSCRPDGPRLYDLLNTLPMDQFGVMSWFVVDKEEEIFELDDVRDEDKVMMALWSRWILLNRNKFVHDYFQGTVAFIDEYWEMIKLAAGWSALRVWLLMLVVNRFLEGSHVAKILKHYEQLAGMV
ncbi:hypothetical protein NEOLEDRAFT_952938 [Neolentinus lepideus HHB14362 ss-1]|uniref:Uncharacterized protein n=1 Tax=Neolentinus lepideus HHB14362 ss-1 TaxID=1314782 RepID=A0A165UES5_9AGAM|nr:hypothetical protein NEOLEDRAFT_952938 [Neolentinus lepideus HHB14362 ss-1]